MSFSSLYSKIWIIPTKQKRLPIVLQHNSSILVARQRGLHGLTLAFLDRVGDVYYIFNSWGVSETMV
jgi:hypothetical protein